MTNEEKSKKKQLKRDHGVSPRSNYDNGSKAGVYTTTEAKAAYDHLSDYHKKKGWDSSGWWAKKG